MEPVGVPAHGAEVIRWEALQSQGLWLPRGHEAELRAADVGAVTSPTPHRAHVILPHLRPRLRVCRTNREISHPDFIHLEDHLFLRVDDTVVMGIDSDLVAAINLLSIEKSRYTAVDSNTKGKGKPPMNMLRVSELNSANRQCICLSSVKGFCRLFKLSPCLVSFDRVDPLFELLLKCERRLQPSPALRFMPRSSRKPQSTGSRPGRGPRESWK